MLTFRYSSDIPKSICSSALYTLMLKTSSSIDLSTRVTQTIVEYNEFDDNGSRSDDSSKKFAFKKFSKIAAQLTSRLKISAPTDSSTSAAQIRVKHDEVGGDGGVGSKLVKKSLKVEKLSNSPKASKSWKICKGHWFGGTLTKAPILFHLDTKNSKALTVF